MAVEHFNPDVDGDENIVQIAALTPTDNAVIIGNGSAWTAESGATLRTSLGLGIGVDVQAYDADLAAWAGVNPSSYLTTAAAAAAYQPLDADLTAWAGVNPSSYLTTAAAAAAYQPLDGDLTSWAAVTRASGFDTFAATPSSANLRALLSDESGSGALLFAGGALGTPASGVLTNCTGLPNASVVGLGTAALVADSGLMHIAGSEVATGKKMFPSTSGIRELNPTLYFERANGTRNGYINILDGGTMSIENEQTNGALNLRTNGSGTVQANGDPVMTRGAAETVTGSKTFTSIVNLSRAVAQAATVNGQTTGSSYVDIVNTGGRLILGVDSSTGGDYFGGSSAYASIISSQANTPMILATNSLPRLTISAAGATRFHTYGAGTLVTDSSGNVTASSDESLKYITGTFKRGLADLRAMDGPVQYQWKNEQIDLAENADTLSDTHIKLAEAKAAHVDADDGKRDDAFAKVSMIEGELKQKAYLDGLTREQTTYTGWTAQGARKGIPEAVKAGPDGLLNFDERPVLAAMYNALLEMAARVEALEAAR